MTAHLPSPRGAELLLDAQPDKAKPRLELRHHGQPEGAWTLKPEAWTLNPDRRRTFSSASTLPSSLVTLALNIAGAVSPGRPAAKCNKTLCNSGPQAGCMTVRRTHSLTCSAAATALAHEHAWTRNSSIHFPSRSSDVGVRTCVSSS